MNNKEIDQLLSEENEHLKKLHQIVKDSLAEEGLIIQNLLNPPEETLTKGQEISDKVARFGGSWKFIIIFMVILVVWWAVAVVLVLRRGLDPPDRLDPRVSSSPWK